MQFTKDETFTNDVTRTGQVKVVDNKLRDSATDSVLESPITLKWGKAGNLLWDILCSCS